LHGGGDINRMYQGEGGQEKGGRRSKIVVAEGARIIRAEWKKPGETQDTTEGTGCGNCSPKENDNGATNLAARKHGTGEKVEVKGGNGKAVMNLTKEKSQDKTGGTVPRGPDKGGNERGTVPTVLRYMRWKRVRWTQNKASVKLKEDTMLGSMSVIRSWKDKRN